MKAKTHVTNGVLLDQLKLTPQGRAALETGLNTGKLVAAQVGGRVWIVPVTPAPEAPANDG